MYKNAQEVIRKSTKAPRELGGMLETFSTSWSPENILLVTIIYILQKIAQVLKKVQSNLQRWMKMYKNS